MQMSKLYQSTNKRKRAAQHRKDAEECAAAGYFDAANVNSAMAEILDPPVLEEYY